jgi:hypothetical protein
VTAGATLHRKVVQIGPDHLGDRSAARRGVGQWSTSSSLMLGRPCASATGP